MNKISFGIPCFNGSDLLDKCLLLLTNSIKHADSLLNHQIIIYDDGSSDNNIQSITNKHCAIWIKEPMNKGLVHGYNVISKLAKHDIICLLDNDVAVPLAFVKDLLILREQQSAYGVLGFVSIKISKKDFLNLDTSLIEKSSKFNLISEPTTQLAGYCYSFWKDDWDAIGGFDERYRMFLADSDFCCMLASQFDKISLRINYPKVYHIGHETLYKYKELRWKEQLGKDKEVFYDKWNCEPEVLNFKLTRKCLGW